jgi:uncharacterized protein YbjT (DUF2867 family)
MKIVVIGGTGLIGTKLVNILRERGHDAIAASPQKGVNTITGEGLAQALSGTDIVVDVANSPSWEDKAVLEFFETSGRNVLGAAAAAGVKHHVALSVVGTDKLAASGYFRGKIAQEKLIRESGLPYTIVRATQFFEFVGGIAQSGVDGDTVRLPSAFVQPISSNDVARAMADYALETPRNGIVEIAGPDRMRLPDLVQLYLNAKQDRSKVVADADTLYFGARLDDTTLVPEGEHPRLGSEHVAEWIERTVQPQ